MAFPFLKLPGGKALTARRAAPSELTFAEIRNYIYQYDAQGTRRVAPGRRWKRNAPYAALTRVCREVRKEYCPIQRYAARIQIAWHHVNDFFDVFMKPKDDTGIPAQLIQVMIQRETTYGAALHFLPLMQLKCTYPSLQCEFQYEERASSLLRRFVQFMLELGFSSRNIPNEVDECQTLNSLVNMNDHYAWLRHPISAEWITATKVRRVYADNFSGLLELGARWSGASNRYFQYRFGEWGALRSQIFSSLSGEAKIAWGDLPEFPRAFQILEGKDARPPKLLRIDLTYGFVSGGRANATLAVDILPLIHLQHRFPSMVIECIWNTSNTVYSQVVLDEAEEIMHIINLKNKKWLELIAQNKLSKIEVRRLCKYCGDIEIVLRSGRESQGVLAAVRKEGAQVASMPLLEEMGVAQGRGACFNVYMTVAKDEGKTRFRARAYRAETSAPLYTPVPVTTMVLNYLNLPAELRDRIYHFASIASEPVRIRLRKQVANISYAGLTRVCRQVRKEYLEMQRRNANVEVDWLSLPNYLATYMFNEDNYAVVGGTLQIEISSGDYRDILPLLFLRMRKPELKLAFIYRPKYTGTNGWLNEMFARKIAYHKHVEECWSQDKSAARRDETALRGFGFHNRRFYNGGAYDGVNCIAGGVLDSSAGRKTRDYEHMKSYVQHDIRIAFKRGKEPESFWKDITTDGHGRVIERVLEEAGMWSYFDAFFDPVHITVI
ncbi:hypothetical protein EK21DRAFT_94042 [Setomelanomma holmii]|uniref:Uncharacterized protein n=1 Tax=Setomelanomma holmii TaxID=210430 RepID=A0A9P4GYX1_9PLEO|nr:hypothetical protein EK21DRAFT_94042 [Setomelanomma holmii]